MHIILHSVYVIFWLLDRHSDVLESTKTCSNMLIYYMRVLMVQVTSKQINNWSPYYT